jgi:dGTP triphosphohydrolase
MVNNHENELLMQSQMETCRIIDSKKFPRMSETTQVVFPQKGMSEVSKNRESHSYETALSANMIVTSIAMKLGLKVIDIDYNLSVNNISLAHDIGHFCGHAGAEALDNFLKSKGLAEGFSDNANNLVVIEKNNIEVRDCVIAGLIKYPNELYEGQKKYLSILDIEINKDILHFSSLGIAFEPGRKRTISCDIMDRADENSYSCSDLADFFCNNPGFDTGKIISFIEKRGKAVPSKVACHLDQMLSTIELESKSETKRYFSELKTKLNLNYIITENGLEHVDDSLVYFRKMLSEISMEFYINNERNKPEHRKIMGNMMRFISNVYDGNLSISKHYDQKLRLTGHDPNESMRIKRDMIAEASDWYVINATKELDLVRERTPAVAPCL